MELSIIVLVQKGLSCPSLVIGYVTLRSSAAGDRVVASCDCCSTSLVDCLLCLSCELGLHVFSESFSCRRSRRLVIFPQSKRCLVSEF